MKMQFDRRIFTAAIGGVVIGVLLLTSLLFARYQSENVHYHANFALYINGVRDEFKSFTFYEEVQACTSEADNDPKHRTHMHDQKNDLIHVHAHSVTWGHFFSNLGYTLGDKVLATDSSVLTDQKGKKLVFILNGQKIDSIANRVIGSEDRLLINYGNEDGQALQKRYETITSTATEANTKNDPSTCSGSEALTTTTRLKKALGF